MRRVLPSALLLLLVACQGEEEPTDGAGFTTTPTTPTTSTGDTGTPGCGASAPELLGSSALTTAETVEGPAIGVNLSMHDPDGDLAGGAFWIWHDEVVDGTVETSVPAILSYVIPTLPGDVPCSVTDRTSIYWVLYSDLGVLYNTEYEFGVQVMDASGHASATLIQAVCTMSPSGDPGSC